MKQPQIQNHFIKIGYSLHIWTELIISLMTSTKNSSFVSVNDLDLDTPIDLDHC